MSQRTVDKFIRSYQKFGDKIAQYANFKPSILYELAYAPDDVVNEVIERKEAGENVTLAEVKELKEKAKDLEEKYENALFDSSKAIRVGLERATEIGNLKRQLEEKEKELSILQNKEPEVKVIEKIVAKIPKEYADVEEAIKAKKAEQSELLDKIGLLRKSVEDFENKSKYEATKMAKMVAFATYLSNVTAKVREYDVYLRDDTMTPEIYRHVESAYFSLKDMLMLVEKALGIDTSSIEAKDIRATRIGYNDIVIN